MANPALEKLRQIQEKIKLLITPALVHIDGKVGAHVQPIAFLRGVGVFFGLYILIFIFIGLNKEGALKALETSLSSETVRIMRAHHKGVPSSAHALANADIQHASDHDALAPFIEKAATKGPVPLLPAPMEGLFEVTPIGFLPKISNKNVTPFKAYKKPFHPAGKPLVVIVVRDYGLSERLSDDILSSLPEYVSFMISPYAENPEEWQSRAREDGHELWLEVPVENAQYPRRDPGAQGIMARNSIKENKERLEWLMSRAAGYAGIAMHSDSMLAVNTPMVTHMLGNIAQRGLGVFEMNPDAPDFVEATARDSKAPYAKSMVFLESVSLKMLETMARQSGFVIGVLEPHPNAIQSLKIWLDTLSAKGFAMAPLSAIMEMNGTVVQRSAIPETEHAPDLSDDNHSVTANGAPPPDMHLDAPRHNTHTNHHE